MPVRIGMWWAVLLHRVSDLGAGKVAPGSRRLTIFGQSVTGPVGVLGSNERRSPRFRKSEAKSLLRGRMSGGSAVSRSQWAAATAILLGAP